MGLGTGGRDLGFLYEKVGTLKDLVEGYLSYHGGMNWGQQEIFVDRVNKFLGATGEVLDWGAILGPYGEMTNGFLSRFEPALAASYYEPAGTNGDPILILPESDNAYFDPAFPLPMNKRLRLKKRPALKLYKVPARCLFVDPYGHQLFDDESNIYWPFASSRAFARTVNGYGRVSEPATIVIIQDSFNGNNFAHFLYDWIPRILYFAEIFPDLTKSCKFLLGGTFGRFHREILGRISRLLRITFDQFIFPDGPLLLDLSQPVYFFSDQKESILHPLNMCHNKTVGLVRTLFDDFQATIVQQARIYVSRGDAGGRRIANEAALIDSLAPHGYKSYNLSELTIEQQMSMFRGAQSVIAPHGMGLTHLFFCQTGVDVLELFNPLVGTDAYAFVARSTGLNYNYLLGEEIKDGKASYEIDIASVMSFVSNAT
jgi:hypothetical protein